MVIEIFKLRKEYSLTTLDKKNVDKNPFTQLEKWFSEAIKSSILEPNTMILSTATSDGKPSSRAVLLKEIKADGLVFFTNYESHKGHQLEDNPFCAINFIWLELERQIRIEGKAEKISAGESDFYFGIRPSKSKISAWASPQSQAVPDREFLKEQFIKYENEFSGNLVSRPVNWGGYMVKPLLFEFWQGRPNRLHDRIRYKKENDGWIIERLAP